VDLVGNFTVPVLFGRHYQARLPVAGPTTFPGLARSGGVQVTMRLYGASRSTLARDDSKGAS
jgi:hypothetical protein